MIILDTNVISEALKPRCDPVVTSWLDAQDLRSLYLTSINSAELWAGLAQLPEGARRRSMESALERLFSRLFEHRQLPLDDRAARVYARLVGKITSQGRPLPLADGLIAAIAHAQGFAVATRDVEPFRAAGVDVINPWDHRA